MQWQEAAGKAVEMIPVPPMMGAYARLQAEKIARQRGSELVTIDDVKETEKMYADFMGEEKTSQLRAFIEGTGPAPSIEEDLFFENDRVLYHIDVCYTKYGENSEIVRAALKDIKRSITATMDEEGLTEIMADLSAVPLHGASRFTVGMTGCANCCVNPYMKDFGIIMQHQVDITREPCSRCGQCLKMCVDDAIRLTEDGPEIDSAVCAHCELCARDCPTGTLAVSTRGFRVIAGGAGGRHPVLATVIEDFASRDRVVEILKKAITRLKEADKPGETLRGIIVREGVQALR